jgi:hypothetical protein
MVWRYPKPPKNETPEPHFGGSFNLTIKLRVVTGLFL